MKDEKIDIVMIFDVLEHVLDQQRVLAEIKRVLKEDGVFIFTVPWLSDRRTVVRVEIADNGKIHRLQKSSFHGDYSKEMEDYLVFYEFGYDFLEELQEVFEVEIFCHGGFGGLVSSVFVINDGDQEGGRGQTDNTTD